MAASQVALGLRARLWVGLIARLVAWLLRVLLVFGVSALAWPWVVSFAPAGGLWSFVIMAGLLGLSMGALKVGLRGLRSWLRGGDARGPGAWEAQLEAPWVFGEAVGEFEGMEVLGVFHRGLALTRYAVRRRGALELEMLVRPGLLQPTGLEAARQLKQEMLALRALAGAPGMPELRERGRSEDGVPYLVLSAPSGRPLVELAGQLPAWAVARVGLGLARALSEAHRRGVRLRRLALEELWLDRMGRVSVVDLGAAVHSSQDERRGLGRWEGRGVAPELQVVGARGQVASDIYSLGVALAELWTGAAWSGEASALSDREQESAALAELIRSCLAPTPSGRPRSAAEVSRALRAA